MKKLFIWLPQGRLGNLVFQYQAISKLSGQGRVIALDSEFFDLFEKPKRFLVLPVFRRLRWRAQALWVSLFQSLANHNLIGTIEPERHIVLDTFTCETSNVECKSGYFGNVFLIRGHFYTPQFMDPLPRLKKEALCAAENRLSKIKKSDRVAIHMRFGDFLKWAVFGMPGSACLPDSYYLRAVEFIKSKVPNAHLIIVSDEPDRASAILESAWAPERIEIIRGGTAQSDFALIASCSHALLSASSFSWWAAILIANSNRLLIAPKYWLGFSRKTWYPSGIQSSHFIYVDPNRVAPLAW